MKPQEDVLVDRSCIDDYIKRYLALIREVSAPIGKETSRREGYDLLKYLKRCPLGAGPYPDVSPFEGANRISSDLVILFGVRRLLHDPRVTLPFDEYTVRLGTKQGIDIEAHTKGAHLVGEAFSVAESYFSTKKSKTLKALSERTAKYKILLFNSDAITNIDLYDLQEIDGVYHVVIDVDANLRRFGV
jgi:hypothetical protein